MQVVPTAQLDEFFAAAAQDVWCPDPPLVSATNLVKLQRSTLVILKIANTKEYCRAPLGFFGAGMGIKSTLGSARAFRDSGSLDTQTMFHAINGGTDAGDNREFATPHHVQPGEAFEVSLEFPYGAVVEPIGGANGLNFGTSATDARLRVRIFANGVRRRPVA
jgi:hypothetical protein